MNNNNAVTAQVLVIDPEPVIGDVVHAALESEQHQVEVVRTETEGITLLRSMTAKDRPFDVIFIHRGLQPLACDDIIRIAREKGDCAVILLSCEHSTAVEKNKLRLGADEIVYKPLHPMDIRAIVGRAMEQKPQAPVPEAPHILIIDDDDLVLNSIKDILEDHYQVSANTSPEEGLRLLKQQSYEIVLVDLMMEQMHGLDFIHAAKIIRPSIVAIVVTGFASKEAALDALRVGAWDFLEKPLTPKLVLQTVARAWKTLRTELENRKLLTELRKINGELATANQQLKKTENQLLQSVKLATIGELATGMAHELNQPLGGILLAADLRLKQIREGNFDKVEESFEMILKQVTRASVIINHLRTFGRDSDSVKRAANSINPIIEDSFIIVGEQLNLQGISVNKSLAQNLQPVDCNAIQLEQVFANLLNNAKDALFDAPVKNISVCSQQVENKVVIEITDTGCGISKADLGNIFNPFFTTKEVGKGTGLGLSISYGIITDHGGDLTVFSDFGQGTVFRITLPCV